MDELVLDMFKYIFGAGWLDSAVAILKSNPSTDKPWSSAWGYAYEIYSDVLIPVGLGMLVIWFLVSFMQKASSEQMNFDQIFMLCVKLVAAFYLIQNGFVLFSKIWGFGIALLGDAGAAADTSEQINKALAPAWGSLIGLVDDGYTAEELVEAWDNGVDPEMPGFWTSLGNFGQLMFPWLLAAFMSGCAQFVAYTRVLEMLVRLAVSPIAMADFFVEGLHGTGWRYIKTFLAFALQGFCMLVIGRIYTMIVTELISSGSFMDITVKFFVISFACISLMFKSLSFSKELVGA